MIEQQILSLGPEIEKLSTAKAADEGALIRDAIQRAGWNLVYEDEQSTLCATPTLRNALCFCL
jgi:hypothetical protein